MIRLTKLSLSLIAAVSLVGCGKIHTGHMGVRTDWNGKVEVKMEDEGFYTAWTSRVDEYSAKEIAVKLDNMTPKAADNLSLAELDVTVFYRTKPEAIRTLAVKRTGQSIKVKDVDIDVWLPAYSLVESIARDRIANIVSGMDSLQVHKQRDKVAADAKSAIQRALEVDDPGVFVITRVVVREVKTDVSIEASIRAVVQKEKDLEAAAYNLKVMETNAKAIAVTAASLTPAYVQHEYNQALMKFAEKGGTVILDGSSSSKILNVSK